MESWTQLEKEKKEVFLHLLEDRFMENKYLHSEVSWKDLEKKLQTDEDILSAIYFMETTGGQPDLVTDLISNHWVYVDTCKETPEGRRSLCYDQEALLGRKKNPPKGSALGWIEDMGLELLSEDLYRKLQEKFEFDLKTSSWIKTKEEIRQLGGALFCHKRYGQIFVFHNGADSYYSTRGFRAMVRL